MDCVIETRFVAESNTGLVSEKGSRKTMIFSDIKSAREFGIKHIENVRYVVSWEAISKQCAILRGHEIIE